MSVNKDFFQPGRDFNYDFESAGKPAPGWRSAARVPELLVPTHCAFCGVQCGMYLKVADGQVIGVESRNFPHNRGSLCPKGVVAYQQVNHPERLRYPMIGRCTHLSCAVYYDQARGTLVCPCHEGIFDPQTGAPLAGPPQRSLRKKCAPTGRQHRLCGRGDATMNGDRSFLSETTSDIERRPPPGRIAVVLTGLALGVLLISIQLWLLTIALDRYLAGQGIDTWLLAVISGLVFLGGLVVLRMLARHPHLTPRRGR